MRRLVFLCLIILGSFFQSNGQASSFEKIEYASFDVNSYRTKIKDSAFISLYCSISSGGLVKVYSPGVNKDSSEIYYAQQLLPSELKMINEVFNSQKKLKSHLAKTKLGNNTLYAGSYDYYRMFYPNGSTDSICVIAPFMSLIFYKVDELLTDVLYARKDRLRISHFDIPADFPASLKESFYASKYLPEITSVPGFIIEN